MSEGASLPVRIGDVIAGKYQVERVLGAGAMGVVVAAMHMDLHELRAIKLMLPGALVDAEAVQRFLREARAAARLKSDHVTKIHDVGRLETGFPYIVLELLEGTDLKSLLERERTLSPERAARYVAQACDAVGEAHALGIVHRDLKPANLFLTRGPRGEERVKVLDFGIAKIAEPAGSLDVTKTSAVLGTPLYMSPEQMRAARNADARSDVWALGVILYNMCTGRVPFPGTTVTEVCSAVVSDVPPAPRALRPDLPPALEAIILRCLEKNPAARFAHAHDLGAALNGLARGAAPPVRLGHLSTVVMEPGAPRPPLPPAPAPPAPAPPAPVPPAPALDATRGLQATAAPASLVAVAAAQTQAGSSTVGGSTIGGNPIGANPIGASTERSTSWVQLAAAPSAGALPSAEPAAPPKPAPGKAFAIAGIGLAVLLLGGGGLAAWRYLGAAPAEPGPAATAETPSAATAGPSATASPAVAPAAPVTAEPSATAAPTASATAAPTASAQTVSPPATPPQKAAPRPPATGSKPAAAPKPTSDEFGTGRK